jgi:hypothetical protein
MLQRLAAERFVERLWTRDPSLWYPAAETQAKIRARLGWLALPPSDLADLWAWVLPLRSGRVTNVMYVATGDAGMIARIWRDLAADPSTYPRLILLDTIEPASVQATLATVAWERTAVVLAGTDWTPDSDALARLVSTARSRAVPTQDLPLMVIASPECTPIQAICGESQPALLPLPADLGGRFGVLSALGLAPAALVGWDLARLCAVAQEMAVACRHDQDLAANPGVWLGTTLAVLAQQGRDKLVLLAPPELQPLACWIAAFVSGSLSKHGRGFVPIVAENREQRTENREQRTKNREQRTENREQRAENGERANTGSSARPTITGDEQRMIVGQGAADEDFDRSCIFVELRLAGVSDAAVQARRAAVLAAGQPLVTLELADRYAVAAQMLCWQVAVATTAVVIGLNPFDEPDTAGRHAYLWRRLSRVEQAVLPPPTPIEHHALASVLQRIEPTIRMTGCIAIVAYVSQSPTVRAALQALGRLLTRRYGAATVLVDPLRDLAYATQLLHAGRPSALLLLTAETPSVVAVPGVDWTLNDLRDARIAADVDAWTRMQRPFAHVDLGADAARGLRYCLDLLR